MHRNKSVQTDHFAMVPRPDIPRSSFKMETAHKTTFDPGWLVPVFVDEVLPGDTWNLRMTSFTRMTTPIFPVMDNLYLDHFWFFVPNRLVWPNWNKFMGEQTNPGDSTDYLVPNFPLPADGAPIGSLQDYMGCPTTGQVPAGQGVNIEVNALPFRAYILIWNEWFRDQNLQASVPPAFDDGPDGGSQWDLQKRGKRHDYFTSALPWVQKGASVALPLGNTAPVITGNEHNTTGGTALKIRNTAGLVPPQVGHLGLGAGNGNVQYDQSTWTPMPTPGVVPTNLYADLSEATAATINQLRQSFQVQKLLERDARGGTRYTEIVRAHFGVTSPDARLQRPEYLGGASTPISIHAVPQTSGSPADLATGYTPSPQGNLAAYAQGVGGSGFTASFTEHGYIIGIVSARADLTYQQGLRKMFSRKTRYDFYFPAFAMLGEQAILNREIYAKGDANDELVFGYQERWAEYRYHPSRISGLFRSTAAGTLDGWHLAQHFTTLPTLNATFIEETPPLDRILAVSPAPGSAAFYFDSVTSITAARPLPMYSVPGLVDHF